MNEIATVTPWLNVAGAATYLATTEDAIRALVKRGRLPVHRTETGGSSSAPRNSTAGFSTGNSDERPREAG